MKSILITLMLALVGYTFIVNWQLAETQRLVDTANAQAAVALKVGKKTSNINLTKVD